MRIMRRHLRQAALMTTGAVTCLIAAWPAFADDTPAPSDLRPVQFHDANDYDSRISHAGPLRMLSQSIVALACAEASQIAPDESRQHRRAALAEFAAILQALRQGNAAYDIHDEEEDEKTLERLESLEGQWQAFRTHVPDDATQLAQLDALEQGAAVLLRDAALLVSQIITRVSAPSAGALTLEAVARQRMLAQRVFKDVCLMSAGVATQAAAVELATSVAYFEATMRALQSGSESAGIAAPPDRAAEDHLAKVAVAWGQVAPTLESIMRGTDPDQEALVALFADLNALSDLLALTVAHYEQVIRVSK